MIDRIPGRIAGLTHSILIQSGERYQKWQSYVHARVGSRIQLPLSVHGRTWEATDSSAARKGLHKPNNQEPKERENKTKAARKVSNAKLLSFDVGGRRKESAIGTIPHRGMGDTAPYKVLYCDGGWSRSIGAGMLHSYAVQ